MILPACLGGNLQPKYYATKLHKLLAQIVLSKTFSTLKKPLYIDILYYFSLGLLHM